MSAQKRFGEGDGARFGNARSAIAFRANGQGTLRRTRNFPDCGSIFALHENPESEDVRDEQ
jgi:hypothetical protein